VTIFIILTRVIIVELIKVIVVVTLYSGQHLLLPTQVLLAQLDRRLDAELHGGGQ